MKVVTFLSDFGISSYYIAQMKGVIFKSYPQVTCIDISHSISPQDIQAGAFILRSTVPFFPKGTIHIAVVDPGVGTQRRGIVIITNNHVLIGPDNGLLIPAAQDQGTFTVYEISNKSYISNSISSTFHGRDIFAPIAAHILQGIAFDTIGPIIHDFTYADINEPLVSPTSITGEVVFIDDFGNIITNINRSLVQSKLIAGNMFTITIKEKTVQIPYHQTYGFLPQGQLLLTIGSMNLVEIAINQGNAAKVLDISVRDPIRIAFS